MKRFSVAFLVNGVFIVACVGLELTTPVLCVTSRHAELLHLKSQWPNG